ncbi:hypothetical protein [Azospirillum sp. TSO35-2]|uniref:hypothetical protein n=1 Tax=Azospirillum sp. TSO35-2 TaxID=716796 RepID=UPI000D61022C|nr:hypothetical protein [Azospirillum sp. TSO35-2]PWC33588.1 hypothetical protein TSO352_24520 [Azospirillum sp. TSO35-2]
MATLTRFKGTIGYTIGNGLDPTDACLLTVFIPDSDPPSGHPGYASLDDAIRNGGLFAQYALAFAGTEPGRLNALFDRTKAWADSQTAKFAFVQMAREDDPLFLVARDKNWQQVPSSAIRLPHLGDLVLTPGPGGQIAQHAKNDKLLQLGTFRMERRGGFTTACLPAVDLESGRFVIPFEAGKSFFSAFSVSQPFTAATHIYGGPGGPYIVSRAVPVAVFDTGAMDGLKQPLLAELDLFPHWKCVNDIHELTRLYLKRARIGIVAAGSGAANTVRLNARDTIGRQLAVSLGSDTSQSLAFFPVPSAIRHEIRDPRQWVLQTKEVTLIPMGVFPIEAAQATEEIDRRFKFGPSNTEILEIREKAGRPNVALDFQVRLEETGGSPPTAGFLRRTLARHARGVTPSSIVHDLESGPALTSLVDTVWPAFVGIDGNGAVAPLADVRWDARPPGVYSVQPDRIVRFSTTSRNAIGQALGYEREVAALPEGPMPFTFLDGIAEAPFGQGSFRSDFEQHLAKHRLELRMAGRSLRTVLRSEADGPVRAAGDVPNVTPQGFEVVVNAKGRSYVLAKSDKNGVSIAFTVEITHPRLEQLFQQNGFLLVIPSTKVSATQSGLTLHGRVQLGDWGFDIAFDESQPPGPKTLDAPENRSVVVLKYQKGRLKDLLRDETAWDNRDLLEPHAVTNTKAALGVWLGTIEQHKSQRSFAVVDRVVSDAEWTGVLLINPVIDLDALPTALQGLVAGIDLASFRGHHLGFTQNKLETSGTEGPRIKKSSLFGLIDYKDAPAPPRAPDVFEFRVNRLQVLFANSEVQDFYCLLKVRLPQWFHDPVKRVEGGAPLEEPRPGTDDTAFGILGRYESLTGADGRKINRYSFVYDGGITLVHDDSKIFKHIAIDRVELRTAQSEDRDGGNAKRIVTELLIDATAAFRDDLGSDFLSDIFGFEKLGFSGITIPFEVFIRKVGKVWTNDGFGALPSLRFDGLTLGTDPARRRAGSLLSKFPIKFKAFRFFDLPRGLGEFKFMELFTTGESPDTKHKIEFGLEWDVDFGALAAMLGLDSDLKGSLLIGWLSKNRGISLGLRFDDMGGDQLDIGIGSVLRLRAGYFDVFNAVGKGTESTFIVASDLSVQIFGETLPKEGSGDKIGLLLMPDPQHPLDGPMGWLTTLKVKELGFIDDFALSIGQKIEYVGSGATPREIIDKVKQLQHFSIDPKLTPKERLDRSRTYRNDLSSTLAYNAASDWFIALAGTVKEIAEGYALYNPPALFGGEVGIKELFTISLLYKQETPQVGIYTGTLTLSENLQSIDIGGVRIQLPRVMAKVDTDGGYAVIVGLNLDKPDDFSNAAGAEVGIFKGDAGFMLSHIHGSAFRDVPRFGNPKFRDDVGKVIFSPVNRIMIAARGGIGREIRKSILTAGASITIYGILSGTMAVSNLQRLSQDAQKALRAAGLPDHYTKFWGEVGIIAEVYGVVDFGITRLRLNARLQVGLGLVFETWNDTFAYVRGELSLTAQWVIARFKVFGATIEISIMLHFAIEYREDFTLVKGDRDKYQQWFQTDARPMRPIAGQNAVAFSNAMLAGNWTRTPPAPQPGHKVKVPLLVTLDLTLDDARQPRLIPMTFIPFQPAAKPNDPADAGRFKNLVQLIFDWSLMAFFSSLPSDATPLDFDTLRQIESAIANKEWGGDRAPWPAVSAWTVLNEHFEFELTKGSAAGPAGGTVFRLSQGFVAGATFTGHADETVRLGGAQVDADYLNRLNEFFDRLRVDTAEERGQGRQAAFRSSGAQRSLDDFLFEEYLESILRAVWGQIMAAVERNDWKPKIASGPAGTPPTVAEVRSLLAARSDAIAGLLNRQAFSGARVPDDGNPPKPGTLPLTEMAKLALPVAHWPAAGIASLRLEFPPLAQAVAFDVQDAADIDAITRLAPPFGTLTLEQVKPFQIVEGDRHPMAEQVPLMQKNAQTGTVWTVPEVLAARAYELAHAGASREHLPIVLERFVKHETGPAMQRIAVQYTPVMLVEVPVSAVSASPDAFEIQQMAEADRRRLDDFLRAKVDTDHIEISFWAQANGGNGRITAMLQSPVDPGKSFIGRVNLASDPNPTAIDPGLRATLNEPLPLLRARPVRAERGAFLALIQMAAETNSGGYVLHLDGWAKADTRRLWLAVQVTSTVYAGVLPSFINRFLTAGSLQTDADGSARLVARETLPQVAVVGDPGVFSARLERQNPDTLYHDPAAGPDAPRTLTAEQALSRLETLRSLVPGSLVNLHRRGALPASALDPAGGRDVDMAKRFNLVQMEVVGVGGFDSMPALHDLPTGPERDTAKVENPYIYNWSIPACKYVQRASNDLFPNKPGSGTFIYAAMDRKMRLRASFRDVLGYSVDWQKPLEADLQGRYFDPLISILSLSGLRVWHEVDGRTGDLVIHLRFDPAALLDRATLASRATLANRGGRRSKARLAASGEEANTIRVGGDEAERLRSVRAAYARAMQQLRDTNTTYAVESTLGFVGSTERTKALDLQQRESLYGGLMRCRDALDGMPGNVDIPVFDLPPLRFAQQGIVPTDGTERYQVRWCVGRDAALVWPDIARMPRSKVVAIATDVPLTSDRQAKNPEPAQALANAIRTAFVTNGTPHLRVAYTRDGRNEQSLYVLDARLLTLRLADKRLSPAFAAVTPLGTEPYAKQQAPIWNWAERKKAPSDEPMSDWPSMQIKSFDQDAALGEFLRDIDLALMPAVADAMWAGGDAQCLLVDALLRAKAAIAEAVPSRVVSILDSPDDDAVVAAGAASLGDNLRNSFKKRLGRVADVDTVLAVPLAYEAVGTDGSFLLYGRIEAPGLDQRAAQFLPAALRRNGTGNTLIVQFDAREPAKIDQYLLNLTFSIDHVRWDAQGGGTPSGPVWLKLFTPETSLSLGRDSAGKPAPVDLPVLFKRLITKPDIAVADPRLSQIGEADPLKTAIRKARQWAYRFDVERARAAAQDDWLIDVDFNVAPTAGTALALRADERDIGDVLFEYVVYRQALQSAGIRDLWYEALAYWGGHVARGLAPRPWMLLDGGLARVPQSFTLQEKLRGTMIDVTLGKRGTWQHAGFEYGLEAIAPSKPSPEAGTPRRLSRSQSTTLAAMSIERPASDPVTGEYFAGRRIEIGKLDILKHENAWPSVTILRNARLGNHENVRSLFVYRTDTIRPGEPYTPLLQVTTPLALRGGTVGDALTQLFNELLDDVDAADRPFVDLAWGYDSGQIDHYKKQDVGMRVYAQDPIGLFTARKFQPDASDAIAIVARSLERWEASNGGRPVGGRYVFELRVYSRLTLVEKPLLRFVDLRYELASARPAVRRARKPQTA